MEEMENLRHTLTVLLALSLLLLPTCAPNPWVGKPAPNFTAADMGGNQISLSAYRGKVVLLDFWATWCAGCLMEMPDVKQLYDKYKDKGFVVIGIDLDTDQGQMETFIKKQNIEWPQILDVRRGGGEISQLYRIDVIPSTFLIDKDGIIRYVDLSGPELERAVQLLIRVSAKGQTPHVSRDLPTALQFQEKLLHFEL